MYTVCAMIPRSTDFSLSMAIEHFRSRGLQCEPATSDNGGSGFRAYYGSWAIVAWYDEGAAVLRDSQEMADIPTAPLPVPAEVIASCDRELTLWSDEDHKAEHTNDWIAFVDELIKAVPGMVVHDFVTGTWWKE
jgi:hypothetical protein